MNIGHEVGKRLIVGLPDLVLSKKTASHLRRINAGGVIVFERNFRSGPQFKTLLGQIHDCLGRGLLVMLDHEGGRIIRFSRCLTRFPDALTVGLSKNPAQVRLQGEIEARELKTLGINVNLAPCADVLEKGSDPVIGDRSYGSDPKLVSKMCVERILGLQSNGVAACAKHFPGLGAVPKDPHKHLPTVGLGLDSMRERHLLPFSKSINCGVWSVMSSHVCYPKLDPVYTRPATFSRRIMYDLLRKELGFKGLVISDDMEMGALSKLCSMGEAAVLASEAGHDLLLICSNQDLQLEAFKALKRAYSSKRLKPKEWQGSLERIERFRVKAGCPP